MKTCLCYRCTLSNCFIARGHDQKTLDLGLRWGVAGEGWPVLSVLVPDLRSGQLRAQQGEGTGYWMNKVCL